MKKAFQLFALLALVSGGAAWSVQDGQDTSKDGCCPKEGGCCKEEKQCCGDWHASLCGVEKCDDARCKEVCAMAGEHLKASTPRFMELLKKEFGDKAGECCKKSETKPCAFCAEFIKTVAIPDLKAKMQASLKNPEAVHATTAVNGQGETSTTSTPCSFLKGKLCPFCVEEIADSNFKKFKDVIAKKKGGCCGEKPKQ